MNLDTEEARRLRDSWRLPTFVGQSRRPHYQGSESLPDRIRHD